MFSKQYKARIERCALSISRIRQEEKHLTSVMLIYGFDEKIAQQIGGDAPQVQKLLATGDDRPAMMRGGKMSLDVKDVRATFVNSDDKADRLVLDKSESISANVRRSTASGSGPTLHVRMLFMSDSADAQSESVDFFRRNIGCEVKVRLDKRQTELPLDGSTEAEEE